MKNKYPTRRFMFAILSVIVAIALLTSVIPALAASDGPNSNIPGIGKVNNATLIGMHQNLAEWFNQQDSLFQEAVALDGKIAFFITKEDKANKNPESLRVALAQFETDLATAQTVHTNAGNSIFSTVGFKVNGDVRDRLAAGQQLIAGRAALADTHFRVEQAISNLHKAFNAWRHFHILGTNS